MTEKDAYLTVYLTLILAVVLSLCLTLIEGTRRNAFYLEAECITDIGLNSVLAEYHRELMDQYNLFAIDSSYGTTLPRVQNTGNRMEVYLKKNISRDDVFLDWILYKDFLGMQLEKVEIKRARLLTDQDGRVFRRRAAQAMWDDTNLSLLGEWQNWMQTVESHQLTEQDIAAEKRRLDEELEQYEREEQISETEWITVTVPNPTDYLEAMRRKGILNLVVENPDALSERYFIAENLTESRARENALNQGNWALDDDEDMDEVVERFLFQEYLMQSMSHYHAEPAAEENHILDYQIEYLIAGKETDIEKQAKNIECFGKARQYPNVKAEVLEKYTPFRRLSKKPCTLSDSEYFIDKFEKECRGEIPKLWGDMSNEQKVDFIVKNRYEKLVSNKIMNSIKF